MTLVNPLLFRDFPNVNKYQRGTDPTLNSSKFRSLKKKQYQGDFVLYKNVPCESA